MKYIITIVLVILSLSVYGQDITCKGLIVDANRKGIPYAVVQVKGRSQGTYTDERGNFSIKATVRDTLTFYCVGYEKKELSAKDWQFTTIILEQKVNQLGEVTVSYKKRKIKRGRLGVRSRPFGEAYFGPGYEYGIFLFSHEIRNGTIDHIYLYVRDQGIPTNKFRVHVYDADTATKYPIADITDTNLIVHAVKGEEWVDIDVSAKRIPIRHGLVISMEWLEGYGNDNQVIERGIYSYKGQVLGLAPNKYGQYTFFRNTFLANENAKGEFTSIDVLAPQIYITYTFSK